MPVLKDADLTRFTSELFQAAGVSKIDSDIVAKSLVGSNLRGHDSHGVMRAPFYIGKVQDGSVDPKATLIVEKQSASSIVGDGGWGFGQVVAQDMMRRLIAKAETSAIVCGTLRRACHIGRLGEYAEMAAAKGLTAMVIANNSGAGQRVAPVGGKRPRLGTNPICIGMPGGSSGPFVFDIGTSATAEGKVRVKKIAGQQVPSGWILDPDGKPTTDPNQLYGDPPGTILPMGGDQAYKGFGLSYMIEMLAGGFSGGQCAFPNPPPPLGNCAIFWVMNPEFFGGAAHLQTEVSNLEKYVRDVPRIDGVKEITLPGDPERRTLHERTANGIPLDDGNWKALTDLAAKLNVAVPNV